MAARTARAGARDDAPAWRPEGFEAYRARWPATPPLPLPPPADGDTTARFAALWHDLGPDPIARARPRLAAIARDTSVVFVRGYLGNYMRGNLVPACRALRAAGVDAFIARTGAGATVATNARRVHARIVKRLDDRRRLVLAGHSKGGLECLQLLADAPALAARTRVVLLSQTPRGPSGVLASLLLHAHADSLAPRRRWAERLQRLGLRLLGARAGGLELTARGLPGVIARLDAARAGLGVPILQTSSWSSRPTVWLDSFHERLGEIRPGVAHDGQFYLDDLVWPGLPHVLLPHLDHAQPVMDGFGFDSRRYWLALVLLALGS